MKTLNQRKKLGNDFFLAEPHIVAEKLIGKLLVRKIKDKILIARIVETEAYFGNKDPASRACKNGDLKETMEMEAGSILVFGVHNNWLVNFVTGEKGVASAVLIRALDPINFQGKCNGPGLLTKCLMIDKSFHKKNLTFINDLEVYDDEFNFEIVKSFRIGVTKDLDEKLRFYLKDNKHVCRILAGEKF